MFIRTRNMGEERYMLPIGTVLGERKLYNFTPCYAIFIRYLPEYLTTFKLPTEILKNLVEMKLASKSAITWHDGLYGVENITRYSVNPDVAIAALDALDKAIDKEIDLHKTLCDLKGKSLYLLWECKHGTTIYLPVATREYVGIQSARA